MPIEEDEHGTYILNSKDLRAIEHVQRLVEIGVDSLKIEGRTKSPYYVARTAQAYRQAIDDAVAGKPLDPALLRELEGLANRGYTDGFYQRHHDADYQNYLRGHSESDRSLYVGDAVALRCGARPDGNRGQEPVFASATASNACIRRATSPSPWRAWKTPPAQPSPSRPAAATASGSTCRPTAAGAFIARFL